MTLSSPPHLFDDGTFRATVDLGAYRLSAIKKTAYRVADRCTVILGTVRERSIDIAFSFKPGTSEPVAREALRMFFQELLDQELREQIAEETGPLRTLILAQAFSKTNLIRSE